ncbi:chromosome partition protein MukB [Phocoenobacter skyensis]|uniref:Bacterial condensin subunit MukB n=1 Tax=Phocoenobacter skyensis TaxID=97481 RepID=A0A1H7Y7L8_9PAST|nr:chromosome partition protein MukB [Pasteurella skyensis]MDP8078809.1 chromosome partition protein MukB [Pasteurella skyensis]MDP8085865.1 chromosome partition protein MukB [Pasteurella skyensis]MDP8186020.1 chromosome partition protein MukB [Pasteurella skyensis]SEM42130.1 bacterial condensin subunit MukB [Pasteurella skyensis]
MQEQQFELEQEQLVEENLQKVENIIPPVIKKETVARGKFLSLTLINWNGFFARTFDLDELVTTLSGGNGAGKSTTMAGFITALIPDLTLLNFRNTTEAGSTSGSRDKGLHGKLKSGVCYAVLESENSRKQRIISGVRLQQIAGRDKKVDIRPFSLQNISTDHAIIDLLTEKVGDRNARVLALNELKEKYETTTVQFKQYHSITDYHSFLFDLGVLPKRLRSPSDRSKFYKLIEASLYGGISGAITKSLREYLLPENLGVRQAFQDMESALRENRMTLEAIKVTQSDRDMFKKLITESTNYVSADYMRNANERRGNIENVLAQRKNWQEVKAKIELSQTQLVEYSREVSEISEAESSLEVAFNSASDHLNLVTNALRHQEKIERYQDEVNDLVEKIEEQQMAMEEISEQVEVAQAHSDEAEDVVESLRAELADYQQALDSQQTRALQYQQAVQALEKAKNLCGLPQLDLHNIQDYAAEFEAQAEEVTDKVFELEQRLSMSEMAKEKFDKAYELVCKVVGETARSQAWGEAKELLAVYPTQKSQAQQAVALRQKLNELEHKLQQQRNAERLLKEFNQKAQTEFETAQELEAYFEQQQDNLEELEAQLSEALEVRSTQRQQLEQLNQQYQKLSQTAPAWHTAQSALVRLSEQCDTHFEASQQVMQFMQDTLNSEREITLERDKLARQSDQLEEQITRLSQLDGAEDPRLNHLAERLGGILLSELYDDVSIDDAPYFSALYGEARHAIVVRDLEAVKSQLEQLEDCPDDLYLIEGDPNAFDDDVFESMELSDGVVVQVSNRQWRYSKFPEIPLFGRAAREKQLEQLKAQQEEVSGKHAECAFEVQKCQRLYQHLSHFVGTHLNLAFEPNPEDMMQEITTQRVDIERQLSQINGDEQQYRQRRDSCKAQLQLLNKALPQVELLADETLIDRVEECKEQLLEAQEDEQFIRQFGQYLAQLEPIATALQSDPTKFDELEAEYKRSVEEQKLLNQKVFSLSEVMNRRLHFGYESSLQAEGSALTEQLRDRLEKAQLEREKMREQFKQAQSQYTQYNQVLTSLRSSYEAKNEMLVELVREIDELGLRGDSEAEERARTQRDELQQRLSQQRSRKSYLEKQLAVIEADMDNLNRAVRKAERDYKVLREQVVQAKVSWCVVMRLSRNSDVEKRLNRRELAYMSSEELRSISDKALGALRIAVADNEYLRDSLRASEDNRKPENKVAFFIAVYQHLRERIRQDIIKTDDPIDAIEQMEIELSRLTSELTNREKKLAISSESVANILRKTIQREQNRILQLNQGLQNITFGQVKGVRLVVNIRDTHAILLNALSSEKENHKDLFESEKLGFSEALAMLYKRVNPHLELGQRTPQTIGEELLDYRNYLDLDVETYRGADGWMKAQSSSLSTGEAIGTGMSILLMVVQSWEEESRRMRAKDILPCRLLFLDEAARLDAKSINTLFELCDRLDMQLLIAAPENISPEQGTTYKLVRKIANNQEYVHVVGLKGFGND